MVVLWYVQNMLAQRYIKLYFTEALAGKNIAQQTPGIAMHSKQAYN